MRNVSAQSIYSIDWFLHTCSKTHGAIGKNSYEFKYNRCEGSGSQFVQLHTPYTSETMVLIQYCW